MTTEAEEEEDFLEKSSHWSNYSINQFRTHYVYFIASFYLFNNGRTHYLLT